MTDKKSRAPGGGRKPLYPDEGPMKNLTIRLPPATKARLDIVFRNSPDYSSRSHVVAEALDIALPKMEKALKPSPAWVPPAAKPADAEG